MRFFSVNAPSLRAIAFGLGLALVWQAAFLLRFFDAFLFPAPLEIATAFFALFATGAVFADLLNTLFKIALSMALGSILGFALGIALFFLPALYDAISPMLDFFRSIPPTALFPLFLLFFGIGDPTHVALATWICALYLSLHVSKGLRSTSESSVVMAKVLKKSGLDTLLHVRLREALPLIFVGFRTSVSLSVVVVVVCEMFVGTKEGIGRILIDAAYSYQIPKLYAGILVIGLLGYLLNSLVIRAEHSVVHWAGK